MIQSDVRIEAVPIPCSVQRNASVIVYFLKHTQHLLYSFHPVACASSARIDDFEFHESMTTCLFFVDNNESFRDLSEIQKLESHLHAEIVGTIS
jgi:hypothetical protein